MWKTVGTACLDDVVHIALQSCTIIAKTDIPLPETTASLVYRHDQDMTALTTMTKEQNATSVDRARTVIERFFPNLLVTLTDGIGTEIGIEIETETVRGPGSMTRLGDPTIAGRREAVIQALNSQGCASTYLQPLLLLQGLASWDLPRKPVVRTMDPTVTTAKSENIAKVAVIGPTRKQAQMNSQNVSSVT